MTPLLIAIICALASAALYGCTEGKPSALGLASFTASMVWVIYGLAHLVR